MFGRKPDRKIELLRRVSLFSACTDAELATIASHVDEITVEKDRALTEEGQSGNECFILVDGVARATLRGEELAVYGAGAIFGEMSLLDGAPRSATVTTRTPCVLLVLTRQSFATVIESSGSVARKVMQTLASRLRDAEAAPVWS